MQELIPFEPRPFDVIGFSKHGGKAFFNHPGNVLFRSLIDKCKPLLHTKPTPEQYKAMIDHILNVVLHKRQGRFLKLTENKDMCMVMNRKDMEKKILGTLYTSRSLLLSGRRLGETKPKKRKSKGSASTSKANKADGDDADIEESWGSEEENEDEVDNDSMEPTTSARASQQKHDSNDTNTAALIPFDPKPNDVVCSRSKKARDHPGNAFYQSLLGKYLPQIQRNENPTNEEYITWVSEILHVVMHQRKGRFLRPTDASESFCTILSRPEAEFKVRRVLYRYRGNVPSHLKSPKSARVTKAENATTTDYRSPRGSVVEIESLSELDDGDGSLSPDAVITTREVGRADAAATNDIAAIENVQLYGSPEEELEMRRWLNDNQLPQVVGDSLLSHGARNIGDVKLMLQLQPEVLQRELTILDFVKLRRVSE